MPDPNDCPRCGERLKYDSTHEVWYCRTCNWPDAEQTQCANCDQIAVGWDDGTPVCANHYRARMAKP